MASSVIVLSGPPGAGKSTIARPLAQTFDKAVHLRTDHFWHYIVSGSIAPYLPESEEQNQTVVRAIVRAAFAYADGGFTVVVDGIVGPWMLHHYREDARNHPDVPVHYLVLRPDRNETLRRAQARAGSDALVEEGPILDLWDQFENLEGLEHHVIDTTGRPPEHTSKVVAHAVADGNYVL